MRTLSKSLATIILIPSIGLVFFFGQMSLMEGKNLFAPYIDTEFAQDYTPQKFDLITYDFNIDSVFSLIGMPLHEFRDTIDGQIQIRCNYTNDAYLGRQDKNKHLMIGDFAWYRSSITFDTNGKILNINKGWSYD
tara:strand:+ start:288 stop:692 length:405 start_codon:yes stop_codon:yes gene_type:complete